MLDKYCNYDRPEPHVVSCFARCVRIVTTTYRQGASLLRETLLLTLGEGTHTTRGSTHRDTRAHAQLWYTSCCYTAPPLNHVSLIGLYSTIEPAFDSWTTSTSRTSIATTANFKSTSALSGDGFVSHLRHVADTLQLCSLLCPTLN